MKPRKRPRPRQANVETLEGRTLLSGLGAAIARAEHAAKVAAAHVHTVAHGKVSTAYTRQRADGAVNNGGASLRKQISIPESTAGGQVTPTVATLPYPGNLAYTGLSVAPRRNIASIPAASTGPAITVGTPISTAPTNPPIQIATPITTGSTVTVTTNNSSSTTALAAASPSTSTAAATTTAPTTTAPTTTTTTTVAATTTAPAGATGLSPSALPGGMATGQTVNPGGGMLGVTPLSASDVASLKTAVDTFAGNYTSGTDAPADSAATSALQSSLKSLDQTMFAENHVVSPTAVSALQSAVNTFASTYTNGANAATDSAAWGSLQTALATFGMSAATPSSSATGTTTTTATPVPMTGPAGGQGVMMVADLGGFGLTGVVNSLLSGPTLTATQVSTVKTAVDTFAGNYTSGTDVTADAAAIKALGTALQSVAPTLTPAPPTNAPMIPSSTGSTTTVASSTPTATTTTTN